MKKNKVSIGTLEADLAVGADQAAKEATLPVEKYVQPISEVAYQSLHE